MSDLLTDSRRDLKLNAAGAAIRGQSLPLRLFGRCLLVGECWEWQGSKVPAGYGQITITDPLAGFKGLRGTHRVAWEQVNGAIPDGLFVCHRCDNPPCCNPDHLFLGTAVDNNRDRQSKGRTRGLTAGVPERVYEAIRARTHCPAKHEYDEANTYVDKHGHRHCRRCSRDRRRQAA